MFEEFKEQYKQVQTASLRKEEISDTADRAQKRADSLNKAAQDTWHKAVDKFSDLVSSTILTHEDKTYYASIEKLGSEALVLGIAEDKLWVMDPDGEHLYSSASPDGWRHCEWCGRALKFHVVNVAYQRPEHEIAEWLREEGDSPTP